MLIAYNKVMMIFNRRLFKLRIWSHHFLAIQTIPTWFGHHGGRTQFSRAPSELVTVPFPTAGSALSIPFCFILCRVSFKLTVFAICLNDNSRRTKAHLNITYKLTLKSGRKKAERVAEYLSWSLNYSCTLSAKLKV